MWVCARVVGASAKRLLPLPASRARYGAWTNHAISELERQTHNWEVRPEATEGYEKAEVTIGGVDPNELSSQTMEARKVPGLFFVGEVVDVTGHLGGFNFQWAWASGFCAGQIV